MIENTASGKVKCVRNPKFADRNRPDGRFSLGDLEEFVEEARMAGVKTESTLWFNNPNGGSSPNGFYFETSNQFVRQTQGRPVILVSNARLLSITAFLAFLLLLTFIFGVLT